MSAPITQSSVFAFDSAEVAAAIHEGEQPGYFYGRMGTPTQGVLEAVMADLESGEAALATASGMAAMALTLLALVGRGDHLVAQDSLYTTTGELLREVLEPFGVEVSRFDAAHPESLTEVLRWNTRAVLLETPSNPRLRLADVRAISNLAHSVGATVVVDNTFATPVNQRPLLLGADAVVHSATKFLGGHGDLVAGVLVGSAELVERARWQGMRRLGPTIAPFTAWLVLRGIKTLDVRMARHNRSALEVARFLDQHPLVSAVFYPGLASHPQFELARRQMSAYGGVVSFEVADAEVARRVVDRTRLCVRATSLGDVVSLIQHCAGLTQAALSPEERTRAGVTEGLIRLSVGLESASDVIADLEQALTEPPPAAANREGAP